MHGADPQRYGIDRIRQGSKERKTYLTDGAKFYLRRYLQTRKEEENLEEKPLFETLDTTMIYCTVREESVQASHRKYA